MNISNLMLPIAVFLSLTCSSTGLVYISDMSEAPQWNNMTQTPLCLIQKQDCGAGSYCSHTAHRVGWTALLKEIISIQNMREMRIGCKE